MAFKLGFLTATAFTASILVLILLFPWKQAFSAPVAFCRFSSALLQSLVQSLGVVFNPSPRDNSLLRIRFFSLYYLLSALIDFLSVICLHPTIQRYINSIMRILSLLSESSLRVLLCTQVQGL